MRPLKSYRIFTIIIQFVKVPIFHKITGLKPASAEWSDSAEAFAKGGDSDEQVGGVLYVSPPA
jgi:hypothetical protein